MKILLMLIADHGAKVTPLRRGGGKTLLAGAMRGGSCGFASRIFAVLPRVCLAEARLTLGSITQPLWGWGEARGLQKRVQTWF